MLLFVETKMWTKLVLSWGILNCVKWIDKNSILVFVILRNAIKLELKKINSSFCNIKQFNKIGKK